VQVAFVEGRPLEDAELVERARSGDGHAYEELVRRYQGVAARVAYVVAGASGEVEDIVQEAFVRAFRALGRFRSGAPFRPWILRIVANEARNRRRAAGRRARLELRVADDRSSGDAAPSPEAAVLEEGDRAVLVEALGRLREDDRLVIACRFFFELSERETAETLGLRPGTVKSRTSRALTRLRGELAGGAGDE
jgi:RNA polymerase sigma-70 factor (ECF subfamily)